MQAEKSSWITETLLIYCACDALMIQRVTHSQCYLHHKQKSGWFKYLPMVAALPSSCLIHRVACLRVTELAPMLVEFPWISAFEFYNSYTSDRILICQSFWSKEFIGLMRTRLLKPTHLARCHRMIQWVLFRNDCFRMYWPSFTSLSYSSFCLVLYIACGYGNVTLFSD